MVKAYHDYEWLHEKYVEQRLTSTEISIIAGVHRDTILYQLRKNGIERRKKDVGSKKIDAVYKDPKWLYAKHHEELLSAREMAKLAGVDKGTIIFNMKKLSIDYRSRIESYELTKRQGKNKVLNVVRGKKHHWYGKKPTEKRRQSAKKAIRKKWAGYKTKHNLGYYSIRDPDTNELVLEHRYVMSDVIGRKLKNTEDVHHIDEDKENNDPINLFLFRSRGDHMYFHKMKSLGREVALQYEYEHIEFKEEY